MTPRDHAHAGDNRPASMKSGFPEESRQSQGPSAWRDHSRPTEVSLPLQPGHPRAWSTTRPPNRDPVTGEAASSRDWSRRAPAVRASSSIKLQRYGARAFPVSSRGRSALINRD